MSQLDDVIEHGGLTPKRTLRRITRRDFGISVLGTLVGAAVSRMIRIPSVEGAVRDFTIAIIPDPQGLAEACPDKTGRYYTAMMKWIVDNKHIVLTSSEPSFDANIKAAIGVGDCVRSPIPDEVKKAEAAWTILDTNSIAFTTPPGNNDYAGNDPTSRGLRNALIARMVGVKSSFSCTRSRMKRFAPMWLRAIRQHSPSATHLQSSNLNSPIRLPC